MLGYSPQVLSAILPLLCDFDESRAVGVTRAIPTNSVLAWAWSASRLEQRQLQLRHLGDKIPPIKVACYWLDGEAHYIVADGHHRAVAARAAALPLMHATISREYWCRPECYVLKDVTLWRKSLEYERLLLFVTEVEPALVAPLVATGVCYPVSGGLSCDCGIPARVVS